MGKMKMSDVFELPMVVDGYSVESQPSIPTGCIVELVSDIECDSGRDAKYVAHAINNHDRMMEEIKELRDFVRMVADADSASDEVKSFMVHSLVHNAKQLLAKLNQEG